MRIVFMGTPAFAVPSLRRLLEDGHTVPLVVTQADKPAGRGHTLTAPPVKQFAIEQGLQFYQPVTLKDDESFAVLSAANPNSSWWWHTANCCQRACWRCRRTDASTCTRRCFPNIAVPHPSSGR
ncbi:MAG: hypothetical protein FWF49_05125 [Oscillospiraceae bacterium]|nr:hypothetical protein [Oscillospiraceae bacterium]